MTTQHYDAIVVGSGAGGAASAYSLVSAGKRVLLIEKGDSLCTDGRTLDIQRVVHDGEFRNKEKWQDGSGQIVVPEEYFNVGGKTKWYGAALARFDRSEFEADSSRDYSGWPISYEEIAPYYAEAERLLGVRTFAAEQDLNDILQRLFRRSADWERHALPMALSPAIVTDTTESVRFDGFASVKGLKADAETTFIRRIRESRNLELRTNATVVDLLADGDTPFRISGVRLNDGDAVTGDVVVLAAGALHSPRLLQRYIDSHRLSSALPCSANVGRNLKLHLLTAVLAVSASRKTDRLRKTTILLNKRLPHSSVQPLGFDAELISTLVPSPVPRSIARQIGARSYGFFLQTEDGSSPSNRVVDDDGRGFPVIDYDARRSPQALMEHRRLSNALRRDLLKAGYLSFAKRIGIVGTAHACGTLRAGDDASASVVDRRGRVHGLQGLYIADGSVLPRSSRVNPALTIYAWALRVADCITSAKSEPSWRASA